jgi:hypothetical protein
MIYLEKVQDIELLQRRHKEIKAVMDRLQKKYFAHELDEKELKRLYAGLVKELAEIEVKMKENESEK